MAAPRPGAAARLSIAAPCALRHTLAWRPLRTALTGALHKIRATRGGSWPSFSSSVWQLPTFDTHSGGCHSTVGSLVWGVWVATKQRIQSSHMPPCHRHMVIATNFSSLFDLVLCSTPQTWAEYCLELTAVSGYRMFLGPFG